ncbi:hypothetical protein NPIL_263861 [Nephila pilipes]|uniref:Uncharacterized protein n=1 Tax=Nephila pilipes TaxID=299642 RepID=A0A8X6Q621_NEPPI|nr:hypothetical protein NPIL_682761 [Nephila pilipes]GFU08434.1 hypothetical protein NPIL_263861 [Nephila pilipes]
MLYLCFRVKREKFCAEYSHLCQKPSNLTELCQKHPYFCKSDVSNLVIPKLGYYASNSTEEVVRDALMEIYIHNISNDGADPWSWTVPDYQGVIERRRDILPLDSPTDTLVCPPSFRSSLSLLRRRLFTIRSHVHFKHPNGRAFLFFFCFRFRLLCEIEDLFAKMSDSDLGDYSPSSSRSETSEYDITSDEEDSDCDYSLKDA